MTEGTGYKRPPLSSRWKKGQSGNPTGRKKGTPNLRTDLIAELAEVIQINEAGSARRITKQRALLKSLAAKGIQGDARAANLILSLVVRLLEPEQEAPEQAELGAADDAILQEFFAKSLQAKKESR